MEARTAMQVCVLAMIAILVILILYRALRATTSDIKGYWATSNGGLFFLDHDEDERGFRVSTASRLHGTNSGDSYVGRIGWPRRVSVNFPGGKARGALSSDQRAIRWSNGTEWHRQGLN